MTSVTPQNDVELNATEEIEQYKIEKITLDGELLSSSLPQLEMSQSPKIKSARDRSDTNEKTSKYSGRKGSPSPIKREITPRTKSAVCKPTVSSSIPLPISKPSKPAHPCRVSSHNVVKSSSSKLSKPDSSLLRTVGQNISKHTLEIQFLNKKRRLTQLQKDLLEKQKPVLDLYQSLLQIKKKLENLGKSVCLEEIKLVPASGIIGSQECPDGAGESVQPEVILGMQTSIEDIPKTLMELCKNLLSRRNVIVDLLDSIVKSDINVAELTEQIEKLKTEGIQLQEALDVVINEHQGKIKEIVKNWHILINNRKDLGTNLKVEELEEKMKSQETLIAEANQVIHDLQKKIEDKRFSYEKSMKDLNDVIHGLRNQVQKLESDLEAEKKNVSDYRSRINTNHQASKSMRNKITDLENEKKNTDSLNADLNKKVKQLQDQLKHKEAQWNKEKEEMTKNMKHQENMLQKLSSDKSSFETRLEEIQGERTMCEESLMSKLASLQSELETVKRELEQANAEKNEAQEKCKGMEELITKMGLDNKETMNMVSNSMNWGNDLSKGTTKANEYSESMVKDIIIQEYKDKIRELEEENNLHREKIATVEKNRKVPPSETEKIVMNQHDIVSKYKQLLSESEKKLTEKFLALRSQEVAKLTSEIRQLKVRQEHLEELNLKCPTENLQKMVEEGRNKLTELMRKSLESEQKIIQYESIIEKQSKQMNEMENRLRYQVSIVDVLKASREELIIDKDSLTRYTQDLKNALLEVKKEGKMKERLIKELQEKIDDREKQINKLNKELKELEVNLKMTNDKRYKLQDTIVSMEKELQATKAHINGLADINTRYESGQGKLSDREKNNQALMEDLLRTHMVTLILFFIIRNRSFPSTYK
ncbi:myosin heavy chain, clone 203-like isoform X1 [Diorhabda carinulata]|uniref:myosin heavy chain, clone 203-like isoform X1 n=1 Tax=Diorhabda carinulata TaxID=1163345 RepID=UPI0025A2ECFA|nr:myosin heavy chain, clone 203-like isoform X1 [Diorhabda carinulata]